MDTNKNDEMRLINFLFEALMLKRTPRSGYAFLGHGRESVAEHSFGVIIVAFVLGRMRKNVDLEKLLKMTLFHDLAEARTGDMNYMNKRYTTCNEDQAMTDATAGLPFENELLDLWKEWQAKESPEAQLAADADQLDMILELRRLETLGSRDAKDWLTYAQKRLRTKEGQTLFTEISKADPTQWWFEKKEEYWVLNNCK